jgi:hypothetical protein
MAELRALAAIGVLVIVGLERNLPRRSGARGPRAYALVVTRMQKRWRKKRPQDMGFMRYGGRPKAGACEFSILLWKTHRHGSVTI